MLLRQGYVGRGGGGKGSFGIFFFQAKDGILDLVRSRGLGDVYKIQMDCKGNDSGEPAEWCRVDTQEIVEDLGENEVRRKLEKKAGKLLDKLFNR